MGVVVYNEGRVLTLQRATRKNITSDRVKEKKG